MGLLSTLSPREWQVARLVAASYSARGVAEALEIGTRTVENHINAIYHKLRLNELGDEGPALRQSVILAKSMLVVEMDGEG